MPLIVPPHDAPPVRATTRPIVPAYTASTPVPPENVWLGPSTSIVVPMAIHDGRPYVQALIDGHPATLVIDTGVVDTMVDPGALDDTNETKVSLQIGELRFPKLAFVRIGVRAYAERELGIPADGIVGRDLLARYAVQLDFPGRQMTLYRDARAMLPPAQGAVTLPLRVLDGLPAIGASLDNQQSRWFALATGTSGQVALEPSRDRATMLGRNEHSIPYQDVSIAGVNSGVLVRTRTLSVGGLTFNQPLVALLDRSRFEGNDITGSLGATMLSGVSVTIDEPASSATIVAPPGATLARFYEPSGIGLEMRHGAILVRNVVPGTPADEHLRPGDEIVSINGLAPATLEFARSLLDGNPGTKASIVYRRWHLTHSVTLTLHVIV
ncbi:MAG: PDZ domain-containing protein [Candidatus Eremiobacteraeota bacterium]|nr:PDZ domain-containing protein [Candidatus Eremiobacteraeota bacterium]